MQSFVARPEQARLSALFVTTLRETERADRAGREQQGEGAEEGEAGEETEGVAQTDVKKLALLPRFKRIPVKRVVSLSNVTSDTKLTVSYDSLVPAGLPSSEVSAPIGLEGV